ncbi:MAG: EutN/CcmL family microcompartment protein [Gammaproteobacteria bacterium]|nr:EutN/CcmL family microcompartment protein [Gammaproteobacteria bacterium]
MQLAKVVGTVVATQKIEGLEGEKLLMIQPLTDALEPAGAAIAAVDSVQAGVGDLVHWVSASEASLVLNNPFVPVDAAITGIVDNVNVEDVGIKDKEEIFA